MMRKMRKVKCTVCNRTGHIQPDCMSNYCPADGCFGEYDEIKDLGIEEIGEETA